MSARVRWVRVHVGRGLGSTDVCGFMVGGVSFEAVRYDDADPTYATHYDRDGVPDAEETFPRRSDAKRWLLARAAGLAEVPRRVRVSDIYVMPVNDPPPRLPRGWRVLASRVVFDERVTVTERNRRRR